MGGDRRQITRDLKGIFAGQDEIAALLPYIEHGKGDRRKRMLVSGNILSENPSAGDLLV